MVTMLSFFIIFLKLKDIMVLENEALVHFQICHKIKAINWKGDYAFISVIGATAKNTYI